MLTERLKRKKGGVGGTKECMSFLAGEQEQQALYSSIIFRTRWKISEYLTMSIGEKAI